MLKLYFCHLRLFSSLLFSLSFGAYMEISSSHGVMVLISYLFSKEQLFFILDITFILSISKFGITGHRWTTRCVINTTCPVSHVPDFIFCCSSNMQFCHCLSIEKIFCLSHMNCPFDCNSCLLWVVAWFFLNEAPKI
jgi:hypothetical protein